MTPKDPGFIKWLQTNLRDLVEPDLTVDGSAGPRTTAATKKFQKLRGLSADGVAGPATIAAIEAALKARAGNLPAEGGELRTMAVAPDADDDAAAENEGSDDAEAQAAAPTQGAAPTQSAAPAQSAAPSQLGQGYVERRVKVRTYGTLPANSRLLLNVPGSSAGAKRLHVLAAQAMKTMAVAIQQDLGIELKIASAWRAHRWQSREQYEAVLISKFGSVKEGKRWLAFDSPHETGLAMDIGVGGLKPTRSTVDFQRKQPLHQWLVQHASEYGWYPYKTEPWHWEYPLSLEAFESGVIGPDDPGPPEDMVSFDLSDEESAIETEDLEEFADDATAPACYPDGESPV